jgi:uncharacterized protein
MKLAPAEWIALAEDERSRALIVPLVGFMDAGTDPAFIAADDMQQRLDEAASMIPSCVLLLRRIFETQVVRPVGTQSARRAKLGRNDPCSCGSGRKFKRCCGTN